MNKVIIFSAPSGSGKTTLVKHSLENFPHLEFSISATTRAPREGEAHGKDYYVHLQGRKTGIPSTRIDRHDERAFVEHEEVYADKFYGTLKSEIERIWKNGKTVIFDVDVVGGVNLKKIFGDQAMSIFIAPPSIEELEKRLIKRNTDSLETIKTRVNKAQEELGYQHLFDQVLINDDLETAKKEIENIISNFTEK